MDKNKSENFEWLVEIFDVNGQKFKKYNVLAYKEEDIKKMKKKLKTKEKFGEELKIQMMSRYWSRAEWEFVIQKNNDRVILTPWCGGDDGIEFDITDDNTFNWIGFAADYTNGKRGGAAKVDVFDQLMYRWNEFLDFVWNFHHKWQRKKNGTDKQD